MKSKFWNKNLFITFLLFFLSLFRSTLMPRSRKRAKDGDIGKAPRKQLNSDYDNRMRYYLFCQALISLGHKEFDKKTALEEEAIWAKAALGPKGQTILCDDIGYTKWGPNLGGTQLEMPPPPPRGTSNDATYKCGPCGFTTNSHPEWVKHALIHDGRHGYGCEWPGCDKWFSTSNSCRDHVRKDHKILSGPDKGKPATVPRLKAWKPPAHLTNGMSGLDIYNNSIKNYGRLPIDKPLHSIELQISVFFKFGPLSFLLKMTIFCCFSTIFHLDLYRFYLKCPFFDFFCLISMLDRYRFYSNCRSPSS